MDPRRSGRLAETLREELEELIGYELSDPRIEITSVAEVLISPDGRRARARLLMPGSAERQQETLTALNGASGHIRRELAARLDVFRMPEVQFEAAVAAELGARMEQILKRVRRGRPRPNSPSTETPGNSSE